MRPLNAGVRRPMIQVRAGDLLTVDAASGPVSFAVLTKHVLFGGNWCFVFFTVQTATSAACDKNRHDGFNAFVDFIEPKRNGRVRRVAGGCNFSHLNGPELLKQCPLKGEVRFGIWRWKDGQRLSAESVRSTASPTDAEREAPEYSCFPADFACELAARRWNPRESLWSA